jgi:hypothetical protein
LKQKRRVATFFTLFCASVNQFFFGILGKRIALSIDGEYEVESTKKNSKYKDVNINYGDDYALKKCVDFFMPSQSL